MTQCVLQTSDGEKMVAVKKPMVTVSADEALKGIGGAHAAAPPLRSEEFGALMDGVWSEIEKTQRVHHPNIVTVFSAVLDDNGLIGIVMQLCSEGSVIDFVQKHGPLDEATLFVLVYEVAAALEALHEMGGMVHCDVKGANILVTPFVDGEGRLLYALKLCDLGIAEIGKKNTTRVITLTNEKPVAGTMRYLPPEILCEEDGEAAGGGRRGPWDHHRARDVYGFGHFLYELATGHIIFDGKDEARVISAIVRRNATPEFQSSDNAPEWLQKLAKLCWESDPAKRLDHFGGAAENRPMSHVLAWLRDANLPLAREAMRQMHNFELFEIRHPFLDMPGRRDGAGAADDEE